MAKKKQPNTLARILTNNCKFCYTVFLVIIFFSPLLIFPGFFDAYELIKISFLRISLLLLGCIYLFQVSRSAQYQFSKEQMKRFFSSRLNKATLFFLLTQLLAFCFSVNKFDSFWGISFRYTGLLTQLLFALTYLLTYLLVTDRAKVLQLFDWMLWGALPLSLWGICEYVGIHPFGINNLQYAGRVAATFGQPTFLALHAIVVVFYCYYRLTHFKGKQLYALYFTNAVLSLFIIIATLSRSAWLAGVVGFAFLFLCSLKEGKKRTNALYGFLLFGGVGLVGVFTLSALQNTEFIQHNDVLLRLAILFQDSDRITFWQTAWNMFLARPLVGFGQDSLYFLFDTFVPVGFNPLVVLDSTHNQLLDIAVTSGVVGIIGYSAVVVELIRNFLEKVKKGVADELLFFIYACLISFFIVSMFNPLSVVNTFIVMVLLAILANRSYSKMSSK
ncbi:MAG: O-antigen ligase family protein [bacterium]